MNLYAGIALNFLSDTKFDHPSDTDYLGDCFGSHDAFNCIGNNPSSPVFFAVSGVILIILAIAVVLRALADVIDEIDEFLSNRAQEEGFRHWKEAAKDDHYWEENAEETQNGLEELTKQKSNCEALDGQFKFYSDGRWECHLLGEDGGTSFIEGYVEVQYQNSQ